MNLFEKLHAVQVGVDAFVKDGENKSDKYSFVSGAQVLDAIRPMLNEHKLLLVPATTGARVHTGETKSGTTRFLTELDKLFIWIDVETGEKYEVPFYAQGVDLAGEKGVGKAETYSEKYFLLKFFHVPTKDDPDNDPRTKAGEKGMRGTQASKETETQQRAAILDMITQITGGDAEKIKAGLITWTKDDSRGVVGHDNVDSISKYALGVVYGKAKKQYEKRMGKPYEQKAEASNAG